MITSDATPEGQSGIDCGEKFELVVKEYVASCTVDPEEDCNQPRSPGVEALHLKIKEYVITVESLGRLSDRQHTKTVILVAFILSIVFTFLVIVLQGLEILHLDRDLVLTLAFSTVGQIAALVWWIVRNLFR